MSRTSKATLIHLGQLPRKKQLPLLSMYVYVPLFATLSIVAQDLAMFSLQLGLTDEKSLVMVR